MVKLIFCWWLFIIEFIKSVHMVIGINSFFFHELELLILKDLMYIWILYQGDHLLFYQDWSSWIENYQGTQHASLTWKQCIFPCWLVLHLCPSVFLQLFVFVGLLFSYFTYLLHHEVIVISLYIMEDNKYLNFFSL